MFGTALGAVGGLTDAFQSFILPTCIFFVVSKDNDKKMSFSLRYIYYIYIYNLSISLLHTRTHKILLLFCMRLGNYCRTVYFSWFYKCYKNQFSSFLLLLLIDYKSYSL